MTNQPKLWIVKKRKNYTILKLQDGKRVQLAKFQSKQDAIKYRQNYIVAVASEKIASVDYDFHQLFLKFSNIKNDGGENIDTCLTKSGGSRYLAHYNHYLVPYLDPCKLHEIGGKRLQSFLWSQTKSNNLFASAGDITLAFFTSLRSA